MPSWRAPECGDRAMGSGSRPKLCQDKSLRNRSLHLMAVDSKGNIYTAELNRGTQRLTFKGKSPAATQ